MGLFSKKNVPDELPNLAFDELEISKSQQIGKSLVSQSPVIPKYKPLSEHSLNLTINKAEEKKDYNAFLSDEEAGFFKDIVKGVSEDIDSIDKLEEWYQNKFLPGDIVHQMRDYWARQSPEVLLKNVNSEIKNKLLEKTNKLHKLEQEWQQAYFGLLAKEEEIRREEKELKDYLAEFISVFKKAKNVESNNLQKE